MANKNVAWLSTNTDFSSTGLQSDRNHFKVCPSRYKYNCYGFIPIEKYHIPKLDHFPNDWAKTMKLPSTLWFTYGKVTSLFETTHPVVQNTPETQKHRRARGGENARPGSFSGRFDSSQERCGSAVSTRKCSTFSTHRTKWWSCIIW